MSNKRQKINGKIKEYEAFSSIISVIWVRMKNATKHWYIFNISMLLNRSEEIQILGNIIMAGLSTFFF